MTVSPNNTNDFEIDTIIKLSMQLGGVMALEQAATGAQWEMRAAFGRHELDLILKKLPAGCRLTRNIELYPLTLTALTGYGGEGDPITLPSDTISIVGDGAYRETASGSETPVVQVDRETWQASGEKASEGSPTRMFVQRGGTVKIYLLPKADTENAIIRLQRERLLADATGGSYTLDIERHWHDYLQFELGSRYA